MRPITIDLNAPSFSKISNDLFTIISSHLVINRLEIAERTLTFKANSDGAEYLIITVATDESINQYDLIAFLVSPGIGHFGRDKWLSEQYERLGGVFSIDISGDSVTLGERPRR